MKTARIISILLLFVMTLSALYLPAVVLAQDGEQPASDNATPTPVLISEEPALIAAEEEEVKDEIALTSEYPKIEAIATGIFEYNIKLEYNGQADRLFDLNTTVPAGWSAYISPQYESIRIPSVAMTSGGYMATTKNVKMTVNPPTWPIADPGEYKITLEAVSDDVIGKIELTAKITAKYVLNAVPANQFYNTKAKAGQDNTFSLQVTNVGTATIDNITFSSDKPEGWEITFKPEKIDLLEIFDPKTVDVNIKPPPKTVSGDYMVSLWISGKQASADKIAVRVTVETPTIWGWVGVAIIVIVVVGLIVIFMRFGRR